MKRTYLTLIAFIGLAIGLGLAGPASASSQEQRGCNELHGLRVAHLRSDRRCELSREDRFVRVRLQVAANSGGPVALRLAPRTTGR